jgi:NAD(P) transhydrogenase subunit beta
MLLGLVTLAILVVIQPESGLKWMLLNAAIASLLGIHLVLAIGGADMPVVVSLLNSYSGWTAAAAGFMLGNDLLIVTGALVGSSGAILSYIMCRAMNRSIWSVIFGGFGTEAPAPTGDVQVPVGEVASIDVNELSRALQKADRVIVIPGYGMAVAQAQHKVREFGNLLRKEGKRVHYAIHPVAGRLPGHMNVLLAEAGVPYDVVLEMDEINADFPTTDVVLVIGANDIVNPGALDDTASPIYGMPVLEAWKANTVVVLKRSMNVGYAGVANPLFFKKNTRMLFGDASESMTRLCAALRK